MKIFTVTNLARVLLLMSAAVLAVGLVGCQGDEEGGGGDLVGDWTGYSTTYGGETRYADEYMKMVLSFRASGELEFIVFEKIGNVWVEAFIGVGTYRVSGSMISIKLPSGPSGEEDEDVQYRVSGNYFTLIGHGYETTYKRVNIAEFKRSLDGPVYTNDPKLSSFAWYSQDDENEYIEFVGTAGTKVYGNGLYRYADDDGTMSYYTNGSKLVLVREDCDWGDNGGGHCTSFETFELTYKITGSGSDMQLSINGDIWLPTSR